MKTTNDNPVDPFGSLGSPIRESKPTAPDPVKEFERIADHSKAVETITETIKKGIDWGCGNPLGHITDGQEADWEGLCLRNEMDSILEDPYTRLQLGCI